MSGNDIALINMAGKAKVHMMSGEIGEAAWFIDQITIEAAARIAALGAALFNATALIGHAMPMDTTALVAGETLVARDVWEAGKSALTAIKGGDDAA